MTPLDGDAVWCWTADRKPVRVDKPDRHTLENRVKLIEFYEPFHGSDGLNQDLEPACQ